MKRYFPVFCVGSVLVLIGFTIFRVLTSNGPASHQQQVAQARQVVESFSQIRTQPLSLEQFNEILARQVMTKAANLSAQERQKLQACISRFYACYSSGNFEDFIKFRRQPPYTLGEHLAATAKTAASQNGMELNSDEDVLRFAWKQWNGTNRIAGVSQESITLAAVQRPDLGLSLRQPSVGKIPGSGALCWEGAVKYQPSPEELLKKEGMLRLFTLELTVRFNTNEDGPATPLLLMGYWDPTRHDWMPLCLCTVFHVQNFDTIF
mgnify:FL=1